MIFFFFFSSRRRHTRLQGDWSSDVCSSDLAALVHRVGGVVRGVRHGLAVRLREHLRGPRPRAGVHPHGPRSVARGSAGGVVVLGEGRALPLPSCERPPPLHHGPRRRVAPLRVAALCVRARPRVATGRTAALRPPTFLRYSRAFMPGLTEQQAGVGSVGEGLEALLRWVRPTFGYVVGARPVLDLGYFANVVPVAPNL